MDCNDLLTVAGDKIKKTNSITSSSERLDSSISLSKGNDSVQGSLSTKLWPQESRGRKITAIGILPHLISKDKGFICLNVQKTVLQMPVQGWQTLYLQ